VQVIKDKGGKVIAQDRPTSKDFSMPQTSIETGDVDFILPLDKIAAKLITLVGAEGGAPKRRSMARKEVTPPTKKNVRPGCAVGAKAAIIKRSR
jgi:hypothetical protein